MSAVGMYGGFAVRRSKLASSGSAASKSDSTNPTPQIARQQTAEFQKISGAMVKRAGPMVAVILSPSNADAAEKLLSLIRYLRPSGTSQPPS